MKPRKPHWNKRVKILNNCERECTRCHKVKAYKGFAKWAGWPNGYTCDCLECRAKVKRERRAAWKDKETEAKYRKKYKSRDTQKLIEKLDNIYYCDPIIKRNREIIAKVKKINRNEAVESKIEWLLSKGYPRELLERVYKFKKSLYVYEWWIDKSRV